MASRSEQVERLARELAELDPLDQARVLANAKRLRQTIQQRPRFTIPVLQGGTKWIGSDLTREAIYGDDGR